MIKDLEQTWNHAAGVTGTITGLDLRTFSIRLTLVKVLKYGYSGYGCYIWIRKNVREEANRDAWPSIEKTDQRRRGQASLLAQA